jgi:arylsulfate sulfotransferase
MKNYLFIFLIGLILVSTYSCKKDVPVEQPEPEIPITDNFTQREIAEQTVVVNPSGYSPLTAVIKIKTNLVTKVQVKVVGKDGYESDVTFRNDSLKTSHVIPVLGLYAGEGTKVQLTLYNWEGKTIGTSAILIVTEALSSEIPRVEINASALSKKKGMNLVSYLAHNLQTSPTFPFIFDAYGKIRWYLDYTSHKTLNKLSYENGLERLKNGNFYFADALLSKIYEVNMFGDVLNEWPIVGFKFHHKVLEKPDGNFILSVTKHGATTLEDQIIEINRNTKQIVNTWDLRKSLQYNRTTLTANRTDWVHVNAVEYDAKDNTIIVSGRTQGVVKLDQNNKVIWILGPHRGWGIAGDGTDLNTKLLQPLDRKHQPITDTFVVNGYTNHPDFEWNWYQHAAKINSFGNLYLFDNGDTRNYLKTTLYSRAVEYKIDAASMTVEQIWQYGRQRGEETYSRIVSDVDYYWDVNHYIFSPGACSKGTKYGKIVEVNKTSNEVLFEATVYAPATSTSPVTFHRTDRLDLYP